MEGELFNLACEYIAWHNFGNDYFVIIGRDFGFFLMGYLVHFTISGIIEIIKEGKHGKRANNK